MSSVPLSISRITAATCLLQATRNDGSSTFYTITSITLCFLVEDMSPQQNPFCLDLRASCEHTTPILYASTSLKREAHMACAELNTPAKEDMNPAYYDR